MVEGHSYIQCTTEGTLILQTPLPSSSCLTQSSDSVNQVRGRPPRRQRRRHRPPAIPQRRTTDLPPPPPVVSFWLLRWHYPSYSFSTSATSIPRRRLPHMSSVLPPTRTKFTPSITTTPESSAWLSMESSSSTLVPTVSHMKTSAYSRHRSWVISSSRPHRPVFIIRIDLHQARRNRRSRTNR